MPRVQGFACSTISRSRLRRCVPKGGSGRAAVLDLDVHQGDGTAKIFEDDADVLTISVHGREQLPVSQADQPYRHRICRTAPGTTNSCESCGRRAVTAPSSSGPISCSFSPGSMGSRRTSLVGCGLTHDGLHGRDRHRILSLHARGVPCVITLGGGYSDPIELTVAGAREYVSALALT